MNTPEEPHLWLADPSVAWSIVLAADLAGAVAPAEFADRLSALNQRLGAGPGPRPVTADDPDSLLRSVAALTSGIPVAAGLGGTRVVLAAEHQYVDGLGMLAVLSELTGVPAVSAARGLGLRRTPPPFRTELRTRLTEVVLAPPARVAHTGTDGTATGSTFADLLLDRRVGVADLVLAATQGVVRFNRDRSTSSRRVAIAVGASEVGGAAPTVADNSALLRLRAAERADRDTIRAFLRDAPTVPSPGRSLEGSRTWVTRAAGLGVRVLGPRLGSTLTVSHLGDVEADVSDLAFYPVAGGSSGVSLGAVTHGGRTRITARGRAERHSAEGLGALLAGIADHLA
jgi:hypothetical protein